MQDYQRQFLDFTIAIGALQFGEFTLKSGRISPYFFNSGLFNTGSRLSRLGRYYAAAIEHAGIAYDMLFGPAYKGIPLAAAAGIALAEIHGRDLPYAFNRKEIKDHGEGGSTVGAELAGRVLIIDDVVTAGTSVGEALTIIWAAGATPAGVVIALDRQERGKGASSAVQEIESACDIKVTAIANLDCLIEYLSSRGDKTRELTGLRAYQNQYGAIY